MRHWSLGVVLAALALTQPAHAQPSPSPLPQTLTRTPERPILEPKGSGWESLAVFNPSVLWDGKQYVMLYRAQNQKGVSSIGLATSEDGVTFQREAQPILSPEGSAEAGGVEDPRLTFLNDRYLLTYTAYDGRSVAQLQAATSPDLRHWTRLGPMLAQADGTWSKSGAVLAQPLNGLYFMYYGDKAIHLATSPDARTWTAEAVPVLAPRPGTWDEGGVEPGPPPILTPRGILLIYNGRDKNNVYAVGAALLDPGDPAHVLARSETPMLRAERPYELGGTVPNVVFVEGLVWKGGQLEVWYGGGDRVIGRAVVKWP